VPRRQFGHLTISALSSRPLWYSIGRTITSVTIETKVLTFSSSTVAAVAAHGVCRTRARPVRSHTRRPSTRVPACFVLPRVNSSRAKYANAYASHSVNFSGGRGCPEPTT